MDQRGIPHPSEGFATASHGLPLWRYLGLNRTRSRGDETDEDIVYTRSFPFGQSCLEAFVGQSKVKFLACCNPGSIGVGSATGEMDAPSGELDEHQHVDPLEPHGLG